MFFPKNLLSASAELTASAATYYTSTNCKTLVTKVTIQNNGAAIRTVTFYLIKTGGAAGDTNKIVNGMSLGIGETVDITALMGQILENGDFIQALADSANDVALFMSGIQIGLTS